MRGGTDRNYNGKKAAYSPEGCLPFRCRERNMSFRLPCWAVMAFFVSGAFASASSSAGGQVPPVPPVPAPAPVPSSPLLQPGAQAPLHAALPPVAAAFARLCASGDLAPVPVLAAADKDGWRQGPGLPGSEPAMQRFKDSEQGTLTLRLSHERIIGGKKTVCTISVEAASPGIIAATQKVLGGAAPALNMGMAATFLVVWTDEGWRAASRLKVGELTSAKRDGRYYRIMAGTTAADARIVVTQLIADPHY